MGIMSSTLSLKMEADTIELSEERVDETAEREIFEDKVVEEIVNRKLGEPEDLTIEPPPGFEFKKPMLIKPRADRPSVQIAGSIAELNEALIKFNQALAAHDDSIRDELSAMKAKTRKVLETLANLGYEPAAELL